MRRLLALVALLLASASIAQLSITREGYWLCENGDGVSRHAEEKDALEACSNAALANPGEVRRVTPPAYRVVADANAQLYLRAPSFPPPLSGVGFNPSEYHVAEDAGSIVVTILRTGSTGACSLDYQTVDGTAIDDTDYVGESGSFSWMDGESGPKTAEIDIIDRAGEQVSRIFTVTVTEDDCPNDLIAFPTATVTIDDTDFDALIGCGWNGSLISDLPDFEGTTHQITPSTSIAQVNALNVGPGDAVLFQAGGTWNVSAAANRLQVRSGVYYGRYGDGANPRIVGTGSWSCSWCGLIEALGDSDVTIDGIDSVSSRAFGILVWQSSSGVTIRNLVVRDTTDWGGLVVMDSSNVLVDNIEATNIPGTPHESIALVNVNGFVVRNVYSHDNGHAAINLKSNTRNGEVYNSEFARTTSDPTFYMERAESIVVYNNYIHDSNPSASNRQLMSIGIEPFDDPNTRYNRNIEIFNNWLTVSAGIGIDFWVKNTSYLGTYNPLTGQVEGSPSVFGNQGGVPEQIMHNIHVHDNTIAFTGQLNESWTGTVRTSDDRANREAIDWSSIIIENNVVWSTGSAPAILLRHGIQAAVRYNLYQTGETGSPSLGTNSVMTSNVLFVDSDNQDYNFQMGSPVIGAASHGGDIGASLPNCPM